MLATPAAAQTITGRIFLPDSVTPMDAVVVSVLDAANKPVARVNSGRDGNYSVRLLASGTYRLQVLRIGFRPSNVDVRDLAIDERRSVNIVLAPVPVDLPTVSILGHDNCGSPGVDPATLLRIWERTTSALNAPRLLEIAGDSSPDVHVLQLDGTIDRPGMRSSSGKDLVPKDGHPEIDSAQARELHTPHFFASTPPDTLATAGYIRMRANGGIIFDAPSGQDLTSDAFLGTHCFSVERPRGRSGWIGLRFKRMKAADSVADIEGTLWLSGDTTRLQRLDFTYTNLPFPPTDVCDRNGKYPFCLATRSGPDAIAGTGGMLTFAYAETGEWLVGAWTIRSTAESYEYRWTGGRSRLENGKMVECYYGPKCEKVNAPYFRLGVTSGAVVDVSRGSTVIYRDSTARAVLAGIETKQGGRKPARIVGYINDLDGQPLRRVMVIVSEPARVTVTNDSGFFEIRSLPARQVDLTARKTGYEPLTFKLPLLADSTRHVRLTLKNSEHP